MNSMTGFPNKAHWISQLAIVLQLIQASLVQAQDFPDFQRRLSNLESLWENESDPLKRRKASGLADSTMFMRLTGQHGNAAKTLDSAIATLKSRQDERNSPNWNDALDLKVGDHFVDPSIERIRCSILMAYKPEPPPPPGITARITWEANQRPMPDLLVPLKGKRTDFELKPPAGFSTVIITLATNSTDSGAKPFRKTRAMVQSVPNWTSTKARMTAMRKEVLKIPDCLGKLTWIHRMDEALSGLDARPGAWQQAVSLPNVDISDIQKNRWPSPEQGTDQVLVFPGGKEGRMIRIRLPAKSAGAENQPSALVALHGLGDTEDSWIEGFGGKVAKHCDARDLILVCPRNGWDPDLKPMLEKWFGKAWGRTGLIGFSRGGSQAMACAAERPADWAAIATIGASGRTGTGEAYRNLPMFLGIGTDDPAHASCVSMAKRLREDGHGRLQFHEEKNTGHLMGPVAILPKALGFLDGFLLEK